MQSAHLGELLGISISSPLPWPDWSVQVGESPDGASLAVSLEAQNPELQMLQRKIASATARREIARLDTFPDVTVGVNYIQVGDPVVNPLTPRAGRDPWALTVAVNLPFWQKKNQAIKANAEANQRATEWDYQNRLNSLQADLTAALAILADAERRLRLYGDELIDLALQSVENSRNAYEAGSTGILEVIDSERSLLELQLLHWRAAADSWQQRVTIQTLTNQPILGTFNPTSQP